MSNRVEWLGFKGGKPCVELNRWEVVELWTDDMLGLNEYQTSFAIEVEGSFMVEEIYLCVTDNQQRKTWRFRYNQDGSTVRFDRCVNGSRRKALRRR